MPRSKETEKVDEGQRTGFGLEIPFDFYLDAWNPLAAQLQATGEVVLVRLPFGFYGGIIVRERDPRSELAGQASY